MATSGILYSTYARNTRFRVDWKRSSYSIPNNNEVIAWTLYLDNGNYWYSNAINIAYVRINGTTVQGAKTWSNKTASGLHKLASGTITLDHEMDGTGTISIGISGSFYGEGSVYGSDAWNLNTIPRASSISASTCYIGRNPTLTINEAAAFTHTVDFALGGTNTRIATKTTATKITSWMIPLSYYAKIPNAKSAVGTLTIYTYNGSTHIGTKTASVTVNAVEADCKPLLVPTAADINSLTLGLTGDANTLIKFYSDVAVDFGESPRHYATIKSLKVTNGTQTALTADGTFYDVDSGIFDFEVTDSRGYITKESITRELVEYINLTTVMNVTNISPAGVATLEIDGKFFHDTFGLVANTLSLALSYRDITNDGPWIATPAGEIIYEEGGNYSSIVYKHGLNYKYTYEFKVVATDKLKTVTFITPPAKGLPAFDWSKDDFNFNVDVNFSGEVYGLLDQTTIDLWKEIIPDL